MKKGDKFTGEIFELIVNKAIIYTISSLWRTIYKSSHHIVKKWISSGFKVQLVAKYGVELNQN